MSPLAARPLPSGVTVRPLQPAAVKAMLADGEELALIDLREELIFSQGHLLFARSVPLSRLELKFARLAPRLSTRIVLCDDADGLVECAAEILQRSGYGNLSYLAGGVFGRIAHVEQVERAVVVCAPTIERRPIDALDGGALRNLGGGGFGPG